MKEIKLKKLTPAELEVLQHELQLYAYEQELGLCFWSIEDFLNALTAVDIANRLWYVLRKKLESDSTYFSLKLKVCDAVILLRCCYWARSQRTEYQKLITEKYKGFIDHQLKSFIPTEQ